MVYKVYIIYLNFGSIYKRKIEMYLDDDYKIDWKMLKTVYNFNKKNVIAMKFCIDDYIFYSNLKSVERKPFLNSILEKEGLI